MNYSKCDHVYFLATNCCRHLSDLNDMDTAEKYIWASNLHFYLGSSKLPVLVDICNVHSPRKHSVEDKEGVGLSKFKFLWLSFLPNVHFILYNFDQLSLIKIILTITIMIFFCNVIRFLLNSIYSFYLMKRIKATIF